MMKYLVGILFCISLLSLSDNSGDCLVREFVSDTSFSQKAVISGRVSGTISSSNILHSADEGVFSFGKFGLFDSGLCGIVFPAYSYSRKVEYPTIFKFTSFDSRLLSYYNTCLRCKGTDDSRDSVPQKSSYRYFVYVLEHILI